MIRAAREADIAAVVAIERASVTAPHWAEKTYRDIVCGRAGERCLLVSENTDNATGRLNGFAAGAVLAGEGELESVAVAEDARRRGLGLALSQAVLDWCAARGATVIRLEVRAASAGAIRLYERLGFEIQGCRPGYYSAPADDAVMMERRIPLVTR